MSNPYYEYSALPHRPTFTWPNGAYVALWVTPNIEHFWFDRPTSTPSDQPVPDVPNIARRDYGLRVGVWRLMDMLDRYQIRATVALNAEVCLHYPEIIRAGRERSWEWMGHGMSNSQRLNTLEPEQEKAVIARTTELITEATGQPPRGWLGPGLVETHRTLQFLADAGYEYVADWCADDQPFQMSAGAGSLISIPYSHEINDYPAYMVHGYTAEQFCQMICDQFDVLYDEGRVSGRVMSLPLHPFLSGHPFRAKWIDKALAYITRHEHVWIATGSEIVDWYRAQTLARADN